uniref:Netrin receptor UNC5 n=1 Tax=Macrostomum lignano TaxID=282301 RepID=A0A1I8IP79_9PLAT
MNVSKSANSVKWLKDGQPLDMAALGDRVTIDHQKQLIIRPLELHDRGNYSCVAELPGLQLHSRPAELWIRVDGGWSDWTTMRSCHPSCDSGTECSSDCFAKSSERRRQCTNPEPQFGGQPCQGRAVISEACDAKCTVNGAWSPWSSWSYCGEDCRSLRHRSCTNPAPRNGGRTCDTDSGAGAAADKEVRNCTDGQCKKEDPALLRYINGDGKTVSSDHAANLNNLAIYIGLFVAAAVVLTVVMVIVYLVRKKSVSGFASGRRRSLRQHQHHTNVNCSTVSSNDKDVKHTNDYFLPANPPLMVLSSDQVPKRSFWMAMVKNAALLPLRQVFTMDTMAACEPPLNAKKPKNKMKPPRETSGTEWPRISRGNPVVGSNRPKRGRRMMAATRAAVPPSSHGESVQCLTRDQSRINQVPDELAALGHRAANNDGGCCGKHKVEQHVRIFLRRQAAQSPVFVATESVARESRMFLISMLVTFFDLTAPASSSAKPHCIKYTTMAIVHRKKSPSAKRRGGAGTNAMDSLKAALSSNVSQAASIASLLEAVEAMKLSLNDFFLCVASMIIYFMQAGFAFLEAGSVRSKNVTNILIKNALDSSSTIVSGAVAERCEFVSYLFYSAAIT